MVYCNLKGGLGNMMFQIAATISIALENATEYSFPNLHPHLSYLDAEDMYNPSLKHSSEYADFLYQLSTEQPLTETRIIAYPFNYVDTHKFNDDVTLDGFFQSEKYFEKHRDEILQVFDFRKTLSNVPFDKFEFGSKRYTSIHVRRGDYASLITFYHELTKEYYTTAIDMLKDKTDEFLVFSDDIEYCKQMFIDIPNIRFVENEKDYIELYLMSICDNNIIANSSFSWWGAWLNKNENKIVVGPSIWFGSSISEYSGDIIPEKWIKI